MSTHLPGFQSFFRFLHNFVLVKLVTSSIRVNVFLAKEQVCYVLDVQGEVNNGLEKNTAEIVSLRINNYHYLHNRLTTSCIIDNCY